MPTCPECNNPLRYHDFYGKNIHLDSFCVVKDGFKKVGNIYKCDSEDCVVYGEFFYTRNEELLQGYPC